MRKYIIFLFAFLLLTISCTKKNETDIQNLKLHGKIKSMRHFTYEAVEKFGEITQGEKVDNSDDDNFYRIFNNKGYVTEKHIFNIDGSIRIKRIFKYNENNLRLGSEEYVFKIVNDPVVIVDTVSAVDTTACDTVAYDGPNYNSPNAVYNDIPAEPTVEYYPDGKLVNKVVNKYINEKLTESFSYDGMGKINYREKNEFDKNSNKICNTVYNSDGSINEKNTYEYNDKSNLIKVRIYSFDGKLKNTFCLSYDNKNNISEAKNQDENSKVINLEKFKYDKYGNIVERITYNIDGSVKNIFKFEYTYDKVGNWIKCIIFTDDKPILIKTQEFEYFE